MISNRSKQLIARSALVGFAIAACGTARCGEREWQTLYKQGGNYYQIGDYARSEELTRKLVAEAVTSFGEDSVYTATSVNALADVFMAEGKSRKAEPLMRRTLAILQRVRGAEHPDTALCLNNLGDLLRRRDKFDEAVAMHRRALALREKIRGPEHFETAVSLNNLAVALHDQGNDAEAEQSLRRALAIFEKMSDSTHQLVPNARRSLDALVGARKTTPGSQAKDSAEAAKRKQGWLDAKWERKRREQKKFGFTTGTIDEFIEEHGNLPIVARTAGSLLYASTRRRDTYYSLFQVRSTEGTQLLLGPVRMPRMDIDRDQFRRYWRLQDPAVEFSEEKSYSGIYVDHLNFAVMFAIFERRPEGDVPIQALFHPVRVREPNLAARRANNALIVRLRGWVNVAMPMLARTMLGLDTP